MNNLRTNKSVLQVIFHLIVLGQIGICNAYLITSLEEHFVHFQSSTKHIIIDNEAQIQAPALAHQLSESEKVNNLLTFKIIISFSLFDHNQISLVQKHISEIPVLKQVFSTSNEKIEITIPRSPPQPLV